MKKLLIILLSLVVIKAEAQTIGYLPATTIGTIRLMGSDDKIIISKDTTINDTTRVDYLIIDTTMSEVPESFKVYSVIRFVKGYRVDVRKGEYSSGLVQTECPEHRSGCLVYHTKLEYNKPDIQYSYYILGDKSQINHVFLVKQLDLQPSGWFIKGL